MQRLNTVDAPVTIDLDSDPDKTRAHRVNAMCFLDETQLVVLVDNSFVLACTAQNKPENPWNVTQLFECNETFQQHIAACGDFIFVGDVSTITAFMKHESEWRSAHSWTVPAARAATTIDAISIMNANTVLVACTINNTPSPTGVVYMYSFYGHMIQKFTVPSFSNEHRKFMCVVACADESILAVTQPSTTEGISNMLLLPVDKTSFQAKYVMQNMKPISISVANTQAYVLHVDGNICILH